MSTEPTDHPTSVVGAAGRGIPGATVARLPIYHRVLGGLAERGIVTVASAQLAVASGVTSAQLRKDLSRLGSYGTRGVGYPVGHLRYEIARELGLTQDWRVLIVGVGNLGHALANYPGFASRGFRVAALVDANPALVGSYVGIAGHQLPVRPVRELADAAADSDANIAVIATPAVSAQPVCDRLVAAGIRSILNFAPVALSVPADVEVRMVDLAVELQILSFHEQRRAQNCPAGQVVGA